MIYCSRLFKNGKERGYLLFSDGKKLVLKDKYKKEFDLKLRDIEYTCKLKGGKYGKAI
jgi:hypothetical protein